MFLGVHSSRGHVRVTAPSGKEYVITPQGTKVPDSDAKALLREGHGFYVVSASADQANNPAPNSNSGG